MEQLHLATTCMTLPGLPLSSASATVAKFKDKPNIAPCQMEFSSIIKGSLVEAK